MGWKRSSICRLHLSFQYRRNNNLLLTLTDSPLIQTRNHTPLSSAFLAKQCGSQIETDQGLRTKLLQNNSLHLAWLSFSISGCFDWLSNSPFAHNPRLSLSPPGVREEGDAVAVVLCDLCRVPPVRLPVLRHRQWPDLRLQHPHGALLVSHLRHLYLRVDRCVLVVPGAVRPDQVGGPRPLAHGYNGLPACLHCALFGGIQAHYAA